MAVSGSVALPHRVFVDSDVIISSLISSAGAAYELLNRTPGIESYISNFSMIELARVTARLGIDDASLKNLVSERIKTVTLDESYTALKQRFASYVLDEHDAHIVAGAKLAAAGFLITYNVRHFKADVLRHELNIILMTPGTFLQYLRSK